MKARLDAPTAAAPTRAAATQMLLTAAKAAEVVLARQIETHRPAWLGDLAVLALVRAAIAAVEAQEAGSNGGSKSD